LQTVTIRIAMPLELVLSLHGVGVPPPGVLLDERPYWIATECFEQLVAELAAWSRVRAIPVLATFDDGNQSDLAVAAPLLAAHGVPAVFFVCTGRLGRPGYLSPVDCRALANQGFTVGSHGIDHVRWPALSPAALEHELAHSRATLEGVLGAPLATAAIPFGAYNRRVLGALRKAGYTTVYNSDEGLSPPGRWLRRRWTWRTGARIDPDAMVARSMHPARRIESAGRELLKSLR
jgi:peptidoglycan/xylan/chitin deacetylase (PgdA/CDA1 family)